MARANSWAAAAQRAERGAARRRRELVAYAKQEAAWEEHQRARHEVDVYENQVDFLLSMHKDCGPEWDWPEIVGLRLPGPPSMSNAQEAAARRRQLAYTPSWSDRWFGGAKRTHEALQSAVVAARADDAHQFEKASIAHAKQIALLEWQKHIGKGVLASDVAAYRTVIEHLSPFAELAESGMTVRVAELRCDVAALECEVANLSIVPSQEKKLSPAGKLSRKAVPLGRFWAIYQDYVCGCALRAARELFALLPLERVVVNVASAGLDTATGHQATTTILAVGFSRAAAGGLNYAALDPSDSMTNFFHRMKFKKTTGRASPRGAGGPGSSLHLDGRSARHPRRLDRPH